MLFTLSLKPVGKTTTLETTVLEDFILKADQALYQAKENGHNQIKLYQE